MIAELVRSSITLLFPDPCQACGKRPAARPLPICGDCMALLARGAAPAAVSSRYIENIFSCLPYEGAIKKCVTSFKYSGKLKFMSVFERLIGRAVMKNTFRLCGADIIVPVPMHPVKKYRRGFNQAEIIARVLSVLLSVRTDVRVLIKKRNTPAQSRSSRKKRFRNLKNSFAVVDRLKIVGRSVVLVDDVMTTGATLDECARELRKAGAKSVRAFTLARTL